MRAACVLPGCHLRNVHLSTVSRVVQVGAPAAASRLDAWAMPWDDHPHAHASSLATSLISSLMSERNALTSALVSEPSPSFAAHAGTQGRSGAHGWFGRAEDAEWLAGSHLVRDAGDDAAGPSDHH